MDWDVEYTDTFGDWWRALNSGEQESVLASVKLLKSLGPALGFPHSSNIQGSRRGNLRELRVQHKGQPLRVLYAFDPRRTALLLLGGNKKGNERWYRTSVPLAERLYDEHLENLREEGLNDG
ncbi:type II toxin-antitoxin system RelE/ParE family toxin [Pseudomonas sp. TE3610]